MSNFSPFANFKKDELNSGYMTLPVTTGLLLNADINSSTSYPGTGSTWKDLSGNNYDGTIDGALYNGILYPKYLTFDGSNDSVVFPLGSAGSDSADFTMGGWFKPTIRNNRFIIRGRDGAGNGWSMRLGTDSNGYSTVFVTTSVFQTISVTGTTILELDKWYFLVATFDQGTSLKIYVNGVLENTTTTIYSTFRSSTEGIWVSRFNAAYFTGNAASVLTYSRVLTDLEVSTIFDTQKSTYGYGSIYEKGFTTEWTVAGDATARTITLPTPTGYTYNYYVNWGDGSAVQNITTYNGGTHTYSNNGTYWVEITGECPAWSQFQNPVEADRVKITDIIYWGNPSKFNGFKNILWGFYGCTNLKSFGRGKIIASSTGWYSGNALFAGCSGITSPIPAGIFDNCTNMSFDSTFTGCSNVVGSIPADLFKFNINSANFFATFNGCSKITGPIPADLFRYNTAVGASGFRATFANTSITEIPTDLFRYNTGVTTNAFYQTFYNCTGLTSIPTDLFRYNTLVSSSAFLGTFQSCTNLASIPTDLFKYNTAVSASGFYRTFYGTAITSIPTDLFRYNTGLTTNAFYQTFTNCVNLTAIPVDLFRYNTLVSVAAFYGTFYNCNALTTIPTDLFRYNTAVSTSGFYQTFAYCDNLATVPVNLFKYNTSADSFYEAFINDTKLVVNKNIFYADGEQSTRFLNKSVDFRNCFSRTYFDGISQGTAPDLWACSFGTGTATSTGCYAGNGNNTTSLSNYTSIPAAWK